MSFSPHQKMGNDKGRASSPKEEDAVVYRNAIQRLRKIRIETDVSPPRLVVSSTRKLEMPVYIHARDAMKHYLKEKKQAILDIRIAYACIDDRDTSSTNVAKVLDGIERLVDIDKHIARLTRFQYENQKHGLEKKTIRNQLQRHVLSDTSHLTTTSLQTRNRNSILDLQKRYATLKDLPAAGIYDHFGPFDFEQDEYGQDTDTPEPFPSSTAANVRYNVVKEAYKHRYITRRRRANRKKDEGR
jgi:hypothetical protein